MLFRLTTVVLLCALTACSVKKYAVRQVGASLNSGPSVFETDEDLILVGDALPFSLKFVETLLAEVPDDRNLLLTAVRGFTLYSYAYVDFPAEQAYEVDLDRGREMRERALRLYLRAARYGFRAVETVYPGFEEQLRRNPQQAVLVTNPKKRERDVPLLYWTAEALGLAVSNAKGDAAMLARLEEVDALIARCTELDPDWDSGALHEFQLTLASARPGGGDRATIDQAFEAAEALRQGSSASLYVSYAEAAAVPAQDVELFQRMIAKALALDLDQYPDQRLLNTVAQRRARWLEQRTEDLFLILEPLEETAP